MTEIHQFLPTFAAHDAIGNHVLRISRLLRQAGFRSDIFADDIHPPMRGEARHYSDFDNRAGAEPSDTWLLYHLSTGSPMAQWLCDRREPLLVDYHNITEARFFDRWAPAAADSMRAARTALDLLAPHTRFALADSAFNESELVEHGFGRTTVAPILLDFSEYDGPPDARTLSRLQRERDDGGARWLFVGRTAPNKCQHDIIGSFAAYRRIFDPKARLTLVGGMTAYLYWRSLEALLQELEVDGAVELADSVQFPQLLARYRTSDVFVCLSEHEGFQVPVLEAMHFDVPVVAYASTAVPDTVGDAAVLLDDKDPAVVAEAVHRILTDDSLRASLVQAGRERVDHFSMERTGKTMLDAITGFIEEERARA